MSTLPAGTIKRVHVNRQVIARNRKLGTTDPAITVQTSHGPRRAQAVDIHGESRMIYRPDKPLKCGARVWLETTAAVTLHGAEL